MSVNGFDDKGVSALAKALPSCAQLATLDVSGNDIRTEGACALAKVLPSCAHLAVLDMSGDGISDKGLEALQTAEAAVGPRLTLYV